MPNIQYNQEQLRFLAWLISNRDRDIFSTLSSAITLKWSRELLNTFKDRWDWYSISLNKSIPWTKAGIHIITATLGLNFEGRLVTDKL